MKNFLLFSIFFEGVKSEKYPTLPQLQFTGRIICYFQEVQSLRCIIFDLKKKKANDTVNQ